MREWLKKIREEHSLSTYETSRMLNISQSHYSSIENGSRGITVINAKKIAKLFGFDWTKFYEKEEKEISDNLNKEK